MTAKKVKSAFQAVGKKKTDKNLNEPDKYKMSKGNEKSKRGLGGKKKPSKAQWKGTKKDNVKNKSIGTEHGKANLAASVEVETPKSSPKIKASKSRETNDKTEKLDQRNAVGSLKTGVDTRKLKSAFESLSKMKSEKNLKGKEKLKVPKGSKKAKMQGKKKQSNGTKSNTVKSGSLGIKHRQAKSAAVTKLGASKVLSETENSKSQKPSEKITKSAFLTLATKKANVKKTKGRSLDVKTNKYSAVSVSSNENVLDNTSLSVTKRNHGDSANLDQGAMMKKQKIEENNGVGNRKSSAGKRKRTKNDTKRLKKKIKRETKKSEKRMTIFNSPSAQRQLEPMTIDQSFSVSDVPRAHYLNDGTILLMMRHPCEISLKGSSSVACLKGTVDIMGYTLDSAKSPLEYFSPDCHSLVTIMTKSATESLSFQDIETGNHSVMEHLPDAVKNVLESDNGVVALRLSKIKSSPCRFVTSFKRFRYIFDEHTIPCATDLDLSPVGCQALVDPVVPVIKMPQEVHHVIDTWAGAVNKEAAPVMVVCGGKGSGKTTLNRFLINTTLNNKEGVYFLDCDIGQSEFTPCGVVSLTYVQSPVCGPAFTHQRTPICAYFFGAVTPRLDLDRYLECVRACVQHYQQLQQSGPLIVNTMGWLKYPGLGLLLDTIRLVCATHVVQLSCEDNYHNVSAFTMKTLNEDGWSKYSVSPDLNAIPAVLTQEPTIIHIETPVAPSYDFKFSPHDYRNLNILSHLGNDLEPGMNLYNMTPKVIPWRSVCLHVLYQELPRTQVMYAFNARMVALCSVDTSESERIIEDGPMFVSESAVFHWKGYGIVRGIDPIKKLMYVVTSLGLDELEGVNALVCGDIPLPEDIIMDQSTVEAPYMDELIRSDGIHANKPRKRMPRKSK